MVDDRLSGPRDVARSEGSARRGERLAAPFWTRNDVRMTGSREPMSLRRRVLVEEAVTEVDGSRLV